MDAKEAIRECQEARAAYVQLGQELVGNGAPDASRSKVKRVITALDLAISALEREHAERPRSVLEEAEEADWKVLGRSVLVESPSGFRIARLVNGEWLDPETYEEIHGVTHWRPLPAPAKEESRG